ncbi:MAG: hypothetical protein M1839_001072 [Geoglossum umbratile]|nr:MAG: hypothetical protein M1839_001072 [Geoglossum umbratile]
MFYDGLRPRGAKKNSEKGRAVPSKEESKPAEIEVDNENEKGPKARASKLEFKIVNETILLVFVESLWKFLLKFHYKTTPDSSNMRFFLTAALVATMAISSVAALGINCKGSGWCTSARDSVATNLNSLIQGIDSNRWYKNGEWIACVQSTGDFVVDASGSVGFCAFLQNTGGTWGSIIKQLAPEIPKHDCRVCGSVPYYFPQGNNNVDDGELTFNMVTMPKGTKCTEGRC